jgi:hypothetical protein
MPVTSTVGRRQSGPLWTIKELAESGDPRVFWHWHGQNRSPKVTKAFRESNAEFSCPRSSLANIRTSVGWMRGTRSPCSARLPPNRGSQSRPRGHAERVAMQMTGHKTRSVFERYNIVSAGDLREAAKRLDAGQGQFQGQSSKNLRRGRKSEICKSLCDNS